MLQLVAGREPGICELRPPGQAEEVMSVRRSLVLAISYSGWVGVVRE
jgi:hypothetical protein